MIEPSTPATYLLALLREYVSRYGKGLFSIVNYPEISREDAKSLIKEGSIYSATQTHNKTVVLELKNRFLYQTKEPNIDDIFKIIEDC